jgi:hypothetical protein
MLIDLFVKADDEGKLERANPVDLWSILAKHGIYAHPMLIHQYGKQLTCLWCGGLITRKVIDEQNWEDSCTQCGFTYSEG